MRTLLCFGCHVLREIAYVDPANRGYCGDCTASMPIGSAVRALGLTSSTIPFKPGDQVQAYTAGELYDGIGIVASVEFDRRVTPMALTFRVVIDSPADEDAPPLGRYLASDLVSTSH